MQIEPQEQHQWLHKLVGKWEYVAEAETEPGKPVSTFKGSESVRSLGGLWVVADGQGEMPGGDIGYTIMTLGFDPDRNRYVGTFIGSMMTHLWLYNGSLDAAGKVLTLDSEGPSMAGDGKMAKYRDVISFKTGDHRVLTSQVLAEDGTWHTFMTATYRRQAQAGEPEAGAR